MTKNQISLTEHRENVRHNRAIEGESQRHNIQDEIIRSRANEIQSSYNSGTLSHYQRQDATNWYAAQNTGAYQQKQGQAALVQANAAQTSSLASWQNSQAAVNNATTRERELAATIARNMVESDHWTNQDQNLKDQLVEMIRHNHAMEKNDALKAASMLISSIAKSVDSAGNVVSRFAGRGTTPASSTLPGFPNEYVIGGN